jgi:hypothetical protein
VHIKAELLFLLPSGRVLVLTTAATVGCRIDLVHRTSSCLCLNNIGEKLHVDVDSDRTGLLFGDCDRAFCYTVLCCVVSCRVVLCCVVSSIAEKSFIGLSNSSIIKW